MQANDIACSCCRTALQQRDYTVKTIKLPNGQTIVSRELNV
jgi:hypothetical protein